MRTARGRAGHLGRAATLLAALALAAALAPIAAGRAAAADRTVGDYAWSEAAGWVNATHGSATAAARVAAGGSGRWLEGYLWGENIGWIKLGNTAAGGGPYANAGGDWGVNVDAPGAGELSGYAWSEAAGWVVFNPACAEGAVCPPAPRMDALGDVDGWAWAENLGWVHLRGATRYAATTYPLFGLGTLPRVVTVSDLSGAAGPLEGACSADFRIALDKPPMRSETVSVAYHTADGISPGASAVSPGDFAGVAPGAGSIDFDGPAETAATISIALADDRVVEADEEFSLLLDAASGGELGASGAGATIRNDDMRLEVAIVGDGTVASTGVAGTPGCSGTPAAPAIDCGASCSGVYAIGETVTLLATPQPADLEADPPVYPSTFAAWSGIPGCGSDATCQVEILAAATAVARFERDTDSDTVPDTLDNCPFDANPTQRNVDGDAYGDACDEDTDGDGVPDPEDNCLFVSNADQIDANRDGRGDACQVALSDSGQQLCASAAGTLIVCPGSGALKGQDAQYPPRSPGFATSPDGKTVADASTGLVWQKTALATTKNWYQAAGVWNATYNASGESICGNLVLAGDTDWRLPTRQELSTLVDLSQGGAKIDPGFFPSTPTAQPYWSADGVGANAWSLAFATGSLASGPASGSGYTRCVRGLPYSATARLRDNGDQTVSDLENGIVWQQSTIETATWANASRLCEDLQLADRTDWRLPSLKELLSLADYGVHGPAVNLAYFPGTASAPYWTADENVFLPGTEAWSVNFSAGDFTTEAKGSNRWVRCVSGKHLVFNQFTPQASLENSAISFHDANPDTIAVAAPWDFTAFGFAAGEAVLVRGSRGGLNDGVFTVAAVSGQTLTLAASDVLVEQAASPEVALTRLAAVRGTTISFTAPSYIDVPGGGLTGIFAAGDAIKVLGAAAPNSRTLSVTAVSATRITVAGGGIVTAPAGPAVTVANLDATVRDEGTGLVWETSWHGPFTWQSALDYCTSTLNARGVPLGGKADWRLPSIKELQSLTDTRILDPVPAGNQPEPALDEELFRIGTGPEAGKFWSSTSYAPNPSLVRGINFTRGYHYDLAKSSSFYARCVRGGFEGVLAVDLTGRWDRPDGGRVGRVTASPAGENPPGTGPIACGVLPRTPTVEDPAGLDDGQCTDIYGTQPASVVTLTADPLRTAVLPPYEATAGTDEIPSVFAGWGGTACDATGGAPPLGTCTLTVRGDATVTAQFLLDRDVDRDNIWDSEDLCPTAYDPEQTDTDRDGRGDACEARLPDTGQSGDYSAVFGEDADYLSHPPAFRGIAVLTAGTISFADTNPDSIRDSAAGFLAAGFAPGDRIRVTGSAIGMNNGEFTLAAVTADTLTLIAPDRVAAAPAGSAVTIANALSRVVVDLNTRLMWQAEDNGVRYNWYQAMGIANGFNVGGAIDVCGNLELGGHDDWRLPTRQELLSIVDFGRSSPAIDGRWFSAAGSEGYWTVTPYPGRPDDVNAWYVDFAGGAAGYGGMDAGRRVRCVREAGPAFGAFAGPGATAEDLGTGLVWQTGDGQNAAGATRTWEQALAYCEGLSLGGRDDWRLPNIRELASIARDTLAPAGAVDASIFPGAVAAEYWSSTSDVRTAANAWSVNFETGATSSFGAKTGGRRARCVRGGPKGSVGSADLAASLADAPDPLVCGDLATCGAGNGNLVYTATITNLGPDDAVGLTIDVALPGAAVGFTPPAGGSCAPSASGAGRISCTAASLAAGAFLTATFTVPPPAGAGSVVGSAAVAALTNDAYPANDADETETWVGFAASRLSVRRTGSGSGRVTTATTGIEGNGISCGADCAESYPIGTLLTLAAAADPASFFNGWSGGGCAGRGPCTVLVNAATLVEASFLLDSDADGVPDAFDNCPAAANPGQADLDRDGQGDGCDGDRDGDGVANAADRCPDSADAAQADTDADGTGDACELRLADTGQTTGFTDTFGEDADYLIAPPSFSATGYHTSATVSFASAPARIVDAGGGFIDAGFAPGDRITVYGSVSNDGRYTAAAVSAGEILLAPGDAVEAEAAGATTSVTNAALLVSAALTFADTDPGAILDPDQGFVAAGFSAGDRITLSGSLHGINDGSYTIGTITPGRITLGGGERISPLSAPAVRTAGTLAFAASSPAQITDAAGLLQESGFGAGDRIVVSGTADGLNDGVFHVASVTAFAITLVEDERLEGQSAGALVTLREEPLMSIRGGGGGTVLDRLTLRSWQRDAGAEALGHDAALAYCQGLVLGGYDDWRLPTRDELLGIPDWGRSAPAIDPMFGGGAGAVWTSTRKFGSAENYLQVRFSNGTSTEADRAVSAGVRCVRGPATAWRSFGTPETAVLDGATGLAWERHDPAAVPPDSGAAPRGWQAALAYCEGLVRSGADDWRLPTVRELASISNPANSPTYDQTAFPGSGVAPYWSATTDPASAGNALAVNFADGTVGSIDKAAEHLVRCVRGGRSGSIGEADVAVAKVLDEDPAIAGGSLRYRVMVVNRGPRDAAGVSLVLDQPEGASYSSSEGSEGVTCAPAGTTVACAIGDLPSREGAWVGIALIAPPSPGTAVARVAVSSVTHDPVAADNTAVVETQIDPDDDADRIADSIDNCPGVANADQADLDLNGVGDACDGDIDGDGVANGDDNCERAANADQLDTDGDLAGDLCEEDDDGDGVADGADRCPLAADALQTDTDGDGRGDACETLLPDTGQASGFTATFGEDADYTLNPPAFRGAVTRTSISFDGAAPGVIRDATGRLHESGIAAGQTLAVSGSQLNDGLYVVAAVAPETIVLAAGTATVAEAAGRPVTLDARRDRTVVDRNTGLVWQRETAGAGMSLAAARSYCESLELGDYPGGTSPDWRLPSKSELLTLLDYGRFAPAIDAAFFPGTIAEPYWTGTDGESGFGWTVDFLAGHAEALSSLLPLRVRCVRGGPLAYPDLDTPEVPPSPWTERADLGTGLVWEQYDAAAPAAAPMTWEGALTYCEGLELGGQGDWRLPNARELGSLFTGAAAAPFDPPALSEAYWSSTTSAATGSYAWAVAFDTGRVFTSEKTAAPGYYVRCVRGGRGGAIGNADLAVSVSAGDPNPVTAGRALSYTSVITNNGVHDATGVVLTDLLPDGGVFESGDWGTDGSCTAVGRVVSCPVGVVPAGGATVAVTVRLAAPVLRGLIENGVSVAGASFDPVLADNAASDATTAVQYQLTVGKGGDGTGSVASTSPAGDIDCPGGCTQEEQVYPPPPDTPVDVALAATPEPGFYFYGWSEGPCRTSTSTPSGGACALSVNGDVFVTASFTPYRLGVALELHGTAAGSVASDPAGISCEGDCEQLYLDPTPVALTASAPAGSFFYGWSGGSCGLPYVDSPPASCLVSVGGNAEEKAVFVSNRLRTRTSSRGTGSGTIDSVDALGVSTGEISCGANCLQHYAAPASVTLRATASPGSSFFAWDGTCASVSGAECTVAVEGDVLVEAVFVTNRLRVALDGTGTGSVIGDASSGISCGADCEELFLAPTSVALTATADPGSVFDRWSLPGCSGGDCAFTAAGEMVVTATFLKDGDGDGVADARDLCSLLPNPEQSDVDGDLLGDECDNCMWVPNADQADGNFDGLGDACGFVGLPRTGQAAPAGPRDDGELRAGIPWPQPRFTAPDGGGAGLIIQDRLTGLQWLRDANCVASSYPALSASGRLNWARALAFVRRVNEGAYPGCSAGFDDWRLPNVNELQSLLNLGSPDPAAWLVNRNFLNVGNAYWSSTAQSGRTGNSWAVNFATGGIVPASRVNKALRVWLVRGTTAAPAAVGATGQVKVIAPGDDGARRAGVPWPIPRMTGMGDGSVKDGLTGLIWSGSAMTPGPNVCRPGVAKTWTAALEHVECLNANRYLGKSDWRLPNRAELRSLVNFGALKPYLWLRAQGVGIPKSGTAETYRYWTSTTSGLPDRAWMVDLGTGASGAGLPKGKLKRVWPVRGGTVLP